MVICDVIYYDVSYMTHIERIMNTLHIYLSYMTMSLRHTSYMIITPDTSYNLAVCLSPLLCDPYLGGGGELCNKEVRKFKIKNIVSKK